MTLIGTSLGESSIILVFRQYFWLDTKYIGDPFLTFSQETAFAHYPTPTPAPMWCGGK
jgi:hypothetical protein